MPLAYSHSAYASILRDIQKLSRSTESIRTGLTASVPSHHRGRRYKSAIIRFVCKIHEFQKTYAPEINWIGKSIEEISGIGWEKNPEILALWRDLALVVKCFSEHPTKPVGTLIISNVGKLVAFGANRVPDGVPLHGHHYVEKIRKYFIVCSERITLASLLDLNSDLPVFTRLSKREHHSMTRRWVAALPKCS